MRLDQLLIITLGKGSLALAHVSHYPLWRFSFLLGPEIMSNAYFEQRISSVLVFRARRQG